MKIWILINMLIIVIVSISVFSVVQSAVAQSQSEITVKTDKESYYFGEDVVITGRVPSNGEKSTQITIEHYDSDGNPQGSGLFHPFNELGDFKTTSQFYESGKYTIRILSQGFEAETFIFINGPNPEFNPVITTEESKFLYGDKISILISNLDKDTKSTLSVSDPQGNIIESDSFLPFLNGTYFKSIPSSGKSWEYSGLYQIQVKSGNYYSSNKTINFTGLDATCDPGTVLKNSVCVPEKPQGNSGGCLIATATFGSKVAPQVQQLRETRDNIVMKTQSGAAFMKGFNSVYYSFAPTVADWERENPVFKETVKATITPLIATLSILSYVDIDSEAEMLGYGIGVILLNIGMYFVAPAFIIIRLKQYKK